MSAEADTVTRLRDLEMRSSHTLGGVDRRVEVLDRRTGRLLVALQPLEAGTAGMALTHLAAVAAKDGAEEQRSWSEEVTR